MLGPAHCARFPGSVSGTRFADPSCPWSGPFPPHRPPLLTEPCSGGSQVLRACPTSRGRASWGYGHWPFPCDPTVHSRRVASRSPGSRAWSFHACTGSATARGPRRRLRWRAVRCCLPFQLQRWHPELLISRLNVPAYASPVNASTPGPCSGRLSSRTVPHDSGSRWVATPFS